MRKIGIIAVLSLMALALAAVPALAATTFNPAAAPTGTHVQRGTPSCSINGQVVSCSTYELAGVGNTNATANLAATYTATVDCTNNGGKLVPVKSTVQGATVSTGQLSPQNGRLTVPALTTAGVQPPPDQQFLDAATCPNGNWDKSIAPNSTVLSGFTYTLSFVGFTGNYITITP